MKSAVTTAIGLFPTATSERVNDSEEETGLVIGRNTPFDVPPPGAGLNTVIVAAPAPAISEVLMVAVSRALLTKVVVRALPFHWTFEPEIKLAPVRASVNPEVPVVAALGLTLVRLGTGLGGAGEIVKL